MAKTTQPETKVETASGGFWGWISEAYDTVADAVVKVASTTYETVKAFGQGLLSGFASSGQMLKEAGTYVAKGAYYVGATAYNAVLAVALYIYGTGKSSATWAIDSSKAAWGRVKELLGGLWGHIRFAGMWLYERLHAIVVRIKNIGGGFVDVVRYVLEQLWYSIKTLPRSLRISAAFWRDVWQYGAPETKRRWANGLYPEWIEADIASVLADRQLEVEAASGEYSPELAN